MLIRTKDIVAMSVNIKEESALPGQGDQQTPPETQGEQPADRPALLARLRAAFAQIDWRATLLIALGMSLLWCILFLSSSTLQILAGIVPVSAGLILGRRVKAQLLLHGLV